MAWAAVAGRALGLLVMAVLGWQILGRELDFNAASGPLRFIHGIDLVIHEAGHTFAFFLPRFLYVLGGSALQVILPAVWHYLLGQLGLLNWAQWLGRLTFGIGILIITIALAILANETYRAWQRAARPAGLR